MTGYYRLATAEVELKKYDEAIDTIKAGLKKQPGESTAAMLLSCQPAVDEIGHIVGGSGHR